MIGFVYVPVWCNWRLLNTLAKHGFETWITKDRVDNIATLRIRKRGKNPV